MLSRRTLLRRSAALGLLLGPRLFVRPAAARSSRRVLVVIFQRGGVDALSAIVPHGDPAYAALRSSIAIPPPGPGPDAALDLDGFFGLHPALAPLLPAWQDGELAVVHACGSHDPTRSHFDAQDFMETGRPGDRDARGGWLNRWLQAVPAESGGVRAVALTSVVPRILSGPAPVYAAASLDGAALGEGRTSQIARAALERMYRDEPDVLGAAAREALAHEDLFRELASPGPSSAEAAYPPGALGRQLRDVAQVLKAGIGVEIAFLDSTGWDTHANQGGSSGVLASLLGGLAGGLAAFRSDLGEAMADVCVLVLSEFGRTAAENGTRGTDHGHGGAMLLLGGTVRGGRVYGAWPGLGRSDLYEGRDLAVTTDFRSVLTEVLERHLFTPDAAALFPGFADDPAGRPGAIA